MVLVDTSIWIDHFRKVSGKLASLLEAEEVAIQDDELLLFIEHHRLMGRGIGLIDAHILASCCIDSCLLWTRDKRLQVVAKEMNIEHSQHHN